MQNLLAMYWIPKMHKNPISFCFIIASPAGSIKPLSKDITTIFKLFCESEKVSYKRYNMVINENLLDYAEKIPSNL